MNRLLPFLMGCVFASAAAHAQDTQITGSVSYRERLAMPAGAVVEVTLEDVTRAGAPPIVVAATIDSSPGQVPVRFALPYDEARIDPRHRYAVRGRILVAGEPVFATADTALVLTQGHGTIANLMLRRVPPAPRPAVSSADAAATAAPAGASPPQPRAPAPDAFAALPASFSGTLPCADCPGIRYQLNLFGDDAYFLRMTYQGRESAPVDRIGTWVRSSDRRVIGLHDAQSNTIEPFAVRDARTLRELDTSGRLIDSTMPHDLRRDAQFRPIDPRVTMRGVYSHLADSGRFVECTTGQSWPVAAEADNRALESAYLTARHAPGAAILAELEGQVVLRPQPDRAGTPATLVVHRFVAIAPGESCAARFASAPFEGTTWRLTHLARDAVAPPSNPRHEPSLVFEPDSNRFSGASGCNRLIGTYETDGESLTLQAAGTMMACPPPASDVESRFTATLTRTARYRLLGRTLELFDAAGERLARFEAR